MRRKPSTGQAKRELHSLAAQLDINVMFEFECPPEAAREKLDTERYRFRTLNASMARFIQLTLAVNERSNFAQGTKVPVYAIANDGNFLVRPVKVKDMDIKGVAERFDFIVDFSTFQPGDTIHLVNRKHVARSRFKTSACGMFPIDESRRRVHAPQTKTS